MNRRVKLLQNLSKQQWDVIVIGGGATGIGSAVDAASRGFKTLLLEQSDFAKGTSSRSTKLIHGGLRYLKQGDLTLVMEALYERGLLCHNAPHLIRHLPFLVPSYHWWEGPYYRIGLKLYDLLAGSLRLKKSKPVSKKKILTLFPNLETTDLRGGIMYYDGQFDDARLAITLVNTLFDFKGTAINYMKVTRLLKKKGTCIGVLAVEQETKKSYKLQAKVVINATGAFSDEIRRLDDPKEKTLISQSQGIHLVFDRHFFPSKHALMIPHTEDGRVLFIIPWHRHLLVGTTDTPISKTSLEPRPFKQEIAFLLSHLNKYLVKPPKEKDILSVFAGLRPLIKQKETKKSAKLSRDHTVIISRSGLLTITGGKWTTYRKMAEDVIDAAIALGKLSPRPCVTEHMALHGWANTNISNDHWSVYGSETKLIKALMKKNPEWKKPLHPRLPYCLAEVIWAVRKEMAQNLEDVLARRTRALFLDAKASIECAPLVAHLMAKELKKSTSWEKKQIISYTRLAKGYLP